MLTSERRGLLSSQQRVDKDVSMSRTRLGEYVLLLAEGRFDSVEWSGQGGVRSTTGNGPVSHSVYGVPRTLIDAYAFTARRLARVRELEDGTWFADVADLQGVWGSGESYADAADDLEQSASSWVEVRLSNGLRVPALGGFDVNPVRNSDAAAA